MKKMSKSKMTREQEQYYDSVLASMTKTTSQHFEPATFIVSGYRKGLILGRARGILWIEWDNGDTEMVTPIALENERGKSN